MDRFKFRVWDNDNEYYSYIDFCDLSKTINELISFQEYFDDGYFKRNTDCVEFCTGLKDKNGNLIYEGDIVIGRKEIVVCEMIEYKDVVEYKDGEYFPFNCTGVYKPEKFEIIGNIHEQKDNK